MSDTHSTAPPGGELDPGDSTTTAPTPVDAQDLPALNGHVEPTDDTPTIISRNGPRSHHEEPTGGLRGRRLAHFELIAPIGVGGMAAVIRARDTQLDRLVALKILPPDMATEPENIRRFQQEARSAARLDHENIARVFFCGEDQRLHFIAFEFVEGENLRTVLERRGRLPVAEALHYILQIAAGLAHAAHRGVVHRDIKPSNIIITPTGRAKLVDMGLARMDRPGEQDLTQSGVTLGTFDYISPEQALEPRDADVRSDIYSLGCTFYHVLTGRPPVPEGTAMKKLHYHEHVKPRDPRELAPGLPDEVAFILDRMMAKKPQDRYQSPEQLVHHLLLAARKLGGSSNVPEGVLSVEAALPPPPGGRPLLLAGMAAGLVILLIVALQVFNRPTAGPTTGSPVVVNAAPPKGDPTTVDVHPPPVPLPKDPADKPPPPLPPPPVVAVAHYETTRDDLDDGRALRDWLKNADKDAPKEIVVGDDVDLFLPKDGDVGLHLSGPKVTITAKPGRRPTIRFNHSSRVQGPNPWTAVGIDSPDVRISGVRLLVDGQNSDVSIAGLRLRGPAGKDCKFTVDNCEFIQARAGTGEKRLTSLATAADAAGASLVLTACRFLSFTEVVENGDVLTNGAFGGDDAVTRDGPVSIDAADCAFGPHAAVFRLEGGAGAAAPTLTLEHCSVLAAGPSAVFDVRAGAAVALKIHASLFSRPDGPADGAVLVRQADRAANVAYTDADNRYQGFGVFRAVDGDDKPAGWPEFQNWASGKASAVLSADADSPWKGDPFAPFRRYAFKQSAAEEHFAAGFQIKEARADLRVTTLLSEKGAPVGVRSLGGVDYADLLRKADRAAEVALLRQRIVDPGASDSAHRIYGTLGEALWASELGDEIVLRWNGTQPVELNRLASAKLQDVTIRPDANCHPILQLVSGKDRDPEPTMFRVFDGKLTLEGLEFVLQPDDDSRRQSLIDLVGQGQCQLKNCIVTLHAGQPGTRLSVVWLADPVKAMVMPMKPADQSPQVSFDSCFIRGDGDLVACQVSRPLGLKADDTLAALRGSFLSVDAAANGPAAPDRKMDLALNKVTTYLTGNLIRLRAGKDKDPANLTPVHCVPAECLFVAATKEPQPLIHFDNSDSTSLLDEKPLGKVLQWDSAGHTTVYGNYTTMLDQTPPGEEMAPPSVGMRDWELTWDKNMGKQVRPFHFAGATPPPSADGPFGGSVLLPFRPLDPTDCGADLDKLNQLLPPAASTPPK